MLAVTVDFNYNNYHIILYWSLLSLTQSVFFLFCFVIAYLHCCISASHPEVRLSRWPGVRVSPTFCLHWPCGKLCHFFFATKQWDVWIHQPSALQEFCCCLQLAPGPLYIMDCALYELCLKPTIELVFCWHWLPRSLGVVYLHYWENAFPLFPKGFFRVFVSGEYTSNQCQPIRRTQSYALINNVSILESWLGFWDFFPWSGPHSR